MHTGTLIPELLELVKRAQAQAQAWERKPFYGLLVPLEVPSDSPPNGSCKRRILLPSLVAEKIAGTLTTKPLRLHHYGEKESEVVGEIHASWVWERGLYIAGDVEARPELEGAGLSCEIAKASVADCRDEVWRIKGGEFTGVAVIPRGRRGPAWRATWLRVGEGEAEGHPEGNLRAERALAQARPIFREGWGIIQGGRR